MSNKFLGLDTINVLKKYIDERILANENNTRIVNLHVYKYVEDGIGRPETPVGGIYNPEGGNIEYPVEWLSLKAVIDGIGGDDMSAVADSLSKGSIWMSVGVSIGSNEFTEWSTPIKISGENGIDVKFAYAHNDKATEEERTSTPSGVDVNNRVEYVWTKYGDNAWTGPTIWAMYSKDASDIHWRYLVTSEEDEDGNPIVPSKPSVGSNWMNNFPISNVSTKNPYMWMSNQIVPAGQSINDANWTDPILFGHYGKDGLDGNVPDYSITLYALSDSVETKPEFVCELEDPDNPEYRLKLEDLLATNNVGEEDGVWHKVPPTMTDAQIMWYVIINVSGGDNKNIESINTIDACSEVMRFSAIDGEQTSSIFTKYLYYWSNKQVLPENITDEDWVEIPEYNAEDLDGSLWMRMGICRLDTSTGEITMVNTEKPWSDPVKLSGPRGPIAYDYRVESRYGIGTADNAPTNWKQMSEIRPTQTYPYIWEKRYLSLYRMKYADTANADGTFDVVEDSFIKTIGEPEVFRLSGLNGATGADGKNGNRLNTVAYTTVDENRTISNFDDINYFISNSTEDTHYTLHGDKFGDFVSGYTGKFANIGTGNMIITAVDANIVGSATSTTEITVAPQESIDLISYNNDNVCEFILIGKPLTTSNPE